MNSMECREETRLPQASRQAWRILALVCQQLQRSWPDRCTGTDWSAARARSLLWAVLTQAGYSLAQINQLLPQPHHDLAHAFPVMQHHPALAHEAEQLAAVVLPVARGAGDLADLASTHRTVVAAEIAAGLEGVLSSGERDAVSHSTRATLFGCTRAAGPEAIWGIWVLAQRQAARAVVDDILVSWGLRGYGGLVDLQLQRAGLA
jgi:hypothetical protein